MAPDVKAVQTMTWRLRYDSLRWYSDGMENNTGIIFTSIIDYSDGSRDTEFFTQKPSFVIELNDEVIRWELREGYINGGDSAVIDYRR